MLYCLRRKFQSGDHIYRNEDEAVSLRTLSALLGEAVQDESTQQKEEVRAAHYS